VTSFFHIRERERERERERITIHMGNWRKYGVCAHGKTISQRRGKGQGGFVVI